MLNYKLKSGLINSQNDVEIKKHLKTNKWYFSSHLHNLLSYTLQTNFKITHVEK